MNPTGKLALFDPREEVEVRGPELRKALGLITLAWVFGSVWITATAGAPLALFAKALRASNFEFGVLSALPFMASLLSVPASLLIERTGARKKIFFYGLYTQRLLWFVIALVPLTIVRMWGFAAVGEAMAMFLILMFLMHACQSVGGPAWTSWMADLVPDRRRGKYFARRRQWGLLSAIPAALFAGWILDRTVAGSLGNPLVTLGWFAILFMIAAVFGVADIHLFQHVPEIPRAGRSGSTLFTALSEPLCNRHFLWFAACVATLLFAVSFMGQFVTLYLIDRVGVNNTQIQLILLVAPSIAQLLLLPVWGAAVDRMGKKPVLAIAALGLVPVGVGWSFLGSGNIWLGYLLAGGGAAFWTGVEVANLNLVLEMSGSNDDDDNPGGGSAYVAVNSVIVNISGCLGGLSAGLIAQGLRNWHWTPAFALGKTFTFYDILFGVSGLLRFVAAVLFLPHIVELGAKPAREALRFMTANIYNNLFDAALQPIRFVQVKLRESYVESDEWKSDDKEK